MAESSVGIKLSGAEYRFLRAELEHHANRLGEDRKAKGNTVKARQDLMKREAQLKFILEKI